MNWKQIPNLKTPEAAVNEWLESVDENGDFSYTVTEEQLAAYARLSDAEKLEWVAEARLIALQQS